ncbi:MAG: hypothetical protein GY810_14885 [Aureispira sp.]|nr:hypothetical protein [Aureispira sp.]
MNKTLWLGIIMLLFAGQLAAQTAQKSGDMAYGANDYRRALAFYKQAIVNDPNNLALQTNLANCFRFTGDFSNAAFYYAKVTKNSKTAPIYDYWHGDVLRSLGKYTEAKKAFAKYGNKKPNRAKLAIASCDFAMKNQKGASPYIVVPEMAINDSKYDDYSPVLYGNEVIFASTRRVKLMGGMGYSSSYTDNTLYVSSRASDGSLNKPQSLRNNGRQVSNNLVPLTYRKDGKMAITTFNKFKQGVRHIRTASLVKLDMELISIKSKGDLENKGTKFPFLKGIQASFPSFSSDGKAIYFAAETIINKTGFGGFDIFVTFYKNGKWTDPQNLGPNINTEGDEICPNLAPDGVLYFTSDGHKGFGGQDIYRAELDKNIWKDVRNLGHVVNSPKDELYFVMDPANSKAYFSSNKTGNFDVYRADLQGSESILPRVSDTDIYVAINDPNNPVSNTTVANNNNNNSNNNNASNNNGGNGTWNVDNSKNNNSYSNNNNNNNDNNKLGDGTTEKVDTWPGDDVKKSNNSNQPCGMNFYIGAIKDAKSGLPLEDAVIYIKNNSTQEKRMVSKPSNQYGEYSIILKPMGDYTILVSRLGYENLMFTVNTGSGGKKTLLGVREMKSTSDSGLDPFGDPVADNGTGTTTNGTGTNTSTTTTTNNSKVPTNRKYAHAAPGRDIPAFGFLIQAISTKKLDAARKYKLQQYGHIVTEAKGALTAYQVGIFANRDHCEESLADIREMGYTDAFIKTVEINNENLADKLANGVNIIYPLTDENTVPAEVEIGKSSSNVGGTGNTDIITKEKEHEDWAEKGMTPRDGEATGKGVEFKVQLGAFKDATKTSFNNLSNLGSIEKQKRSNGLTYYYLASFKTLDSARSARVKAQKKGVDTAFVVAFKDGKKVKISDVIE